MTGERGTKTAADLTERQVAREKLRVGKSLRKWKLLLGLHLWNIDIIYFDSDIPRAEDDESTDPFVADCHVKWEYLTAIIRWDVSKTLNSDRDYVDSVVIHELLHVIVNEMRHFSSDDGIYHEERVVTHLNLVVQWMLEEGYRLGKREGLQNPGRTT